VRIVITILLSSIIFKVYSQTTPIDTVNLRYRYNFNIPIEVSHRIAENSQFIIIYLQASARSKVEIIQKVKVRYLNEQSIESDSILFSTSQSELRKILIRKSDTLPPAFNILLAHTRTEKEYIYPIYLQHDKNFQSSSLLLMDKNGNYPIFKNYIQPTDTIQLRNFSSDKEPSLFIYYYSADFPAADPPMKLSSVPKTLSIDSLFSVKPNTKLNFSEQGLYFVQEDTSTLSGISFRVENKYYPELKKLENLMSAARYLSTANELKRLQKAPDKKKAFDRYWLSLTGSKSTAKKLIHAYYNQIERANKLFTNYKQGWKTDKGLIYTVFGLPDVVSRTYLNESWIYTTTPGTSKNLVFTFTKVKNLFSDDHYVLLREKDLRNDWLQKVGRWRKGLEQF